MKERSPRGIIERLFPGYFALVMATGIVSIGAYAQGMETVATALLWVSGAAYVVLWALTLARVIRYPHAVIADLTSHQKGATFLTMVAATNVLGVQVTMMTTVRGVAVALWSLGIVLWAGLLYTFIGALTVKRVKPALGDGINGAWLLLVVSTESIAVLGSVLATKASNPIGILFTALLAHLIGAMLYIVVISLIFYRWTFFEMTADQATPPYWINMGALAITTVAGANLIAAGPSWSLLSTIAPFLTGTTILFWAFASWWIPLLLIVGIWRHGVQRVRLAYDPQFWSMVFPLGMYSVATLKIATITEVAILSDVARGFLWAALAAWLVLFLAMVAQRPRRNAAPQ